MSHITHRPRILVCDGVHSAGVDLLREHCDIDEQPAITPAQLIDRIPRYDGIILRSRSRLSADILEHALRLKVIGRAGSGLDNVDVAAARQRDIVVLNAPGANTFAVAEHTFGLLLSLARWIPWADAKLKSGGWGKQELVGINVAGKTLGIVGFGRIGREVAIRAQAFGMKVLVNQHTLTPEQLLEGIESVDLHDLLRQSDFVSLHVSLTEETQHLIGSAELALMKPNAFLINTARGGVIDETALFNALEDHRLAGAALDVFSTEPQPLSNLVQHPRVIATPHIAATTEESLRDTSLLIAERVIDYFASIELEPVLPLRIVPSESVYPHEYFDQKRVTRLTKRLAEDGRLSNPPIVVELDDGYMVLDGATRSTAMRQMGLPHMLVQVASTDSDLSLKTWYHVVRQMSRQALVDLLEQLPDVVLMESSAENVMQALYDYGGLCYFHFPNGDILLIKAAHDANRLNVLNRLTNSYIDAGYVSRALSRDVIELQHEYDDMTALVVFPEYTVEQVMQVVQSGRLLPAGITRFIIPGRILRANLPIDILSSDLPLREKNRWLQDHLLERLNKGGIRYYAEPVYLLDE